jgi:hypothetical protein
MSGQQLEEYRKQMQARYGTRDEGEERKLREEQLRRDEELARKLANDHPQGPPERLESNPQYVNSASYYPAQQGYYPAQGGYQQPYQHPYQHPPQGYYSDYYQPSQPRPHESQPLVQQDGFLPDVKDTCCYVNTQVCVLTLAVLMIAGIITGIVVVAVS